MWVTPVEAGGPKKEVYIPMDYSHCGYRASEEEIPDVTNKVFVGHGESTGNEDYSDIIQRAVDYVSSLPADGEGRRGAVLLGSGDFHISRAIEIKASGVVLRGMGASRTRITKEGVERGAAVRMVGGQPETTSAPHAVGADHIAAGSMSVCVVGAKDFATGDLIKIRRPSTAEWIEGLGMKCFGGDLDYTGWKPGDIDIEWTRRVVGIEGDTLRIDAPITTAIRKEYGGATVERVQDKSISESGVESLTIASGEGASIEDHCWDGVWIDGSRDCWVRGVRFRGLAGSAVNIQKGARRISVEGCESESPRSEIGGWRRMTYKTRGEQTLFIHCRAEGGIHDFAVGMSAPGPNAYVECESESPHGYSGPVGSWAGGVLFDIVDIIGGDIEFANKEQWQFGTGWNSGSAMLWQCTAAHIRCYTPDSDSKSSGHGCWGCLQGDAEWTSSNDHVTPRSLFESQLKRRGIDRDLHILPRNTTATSSPTVEVAERLAKESQTEPRLTLHDWIAKLTKTDIADSTGLKDASKIKKQTRQSEATWRYALSDGLLTAEGGLIVGNRYAPPWWNGRTRDNYLREKSRPAVTRFVPGLEGCGATDDLDSVVEYMVTNHQAMLDHNYGLWYDLRRIDHERIRRSDGDVEPPFYEQPFARTGETGATAWDGLSRYDLTRPNEWYWMRLGQFAEKASRRGIILFHEHYFQHNILEAGAHWVDCPWRPTNNINGTPMPEPVPFAGDKRVFMAEQFYDTTNPVMRELHRGYIRTCLDKLADAPNVVHLVGAEYTGPLNFVRFWLETIKEWENEKQRHAYVALSVTKDVQDSIMSDAELSKIVDIIDIRYWHYNTAGLWAPEGGKNLAPRQWMRQMKPGSTTPTEAYRAVRECREAYPGKAVTFYAQKYEQYGWAILMAGGSLPNIAVADERLRQALTAMHPGDGEACWVLEGPNGLLTYTTGERAAVAVARGKYDIYAVDETTGSTEIIKKNVNLEGEYKLPTHICWLQKK